MIETKRYEQLSALGREAIASKRFKEGVELLCAALDDMISDPSNGHMPEDVLNLYHELLAVCGTMAGEMDKREKVEVAGVIREKAEHYRNEGKLTVASDLSEAARQILDTESKGEKSK